MRKVEMDRLREVELLQKHRMESEGLVERQKRKVEEAEDAKEVLQGLQEEMEFKDDTINTYVVRDREMNDELQEARKAALEVRTQALFIQNK